MYKNTRVAGVSACGCSLEGYTSLSIGIYEAVL